MKRTVSIGEVEIGYRRPLALVVGPCVIESRSKCLRLAENLSKLAQTENIPLVFKGSYDKANRTSGDSFRGPGIDRGLSILGEVRSRFGLPVITDVHTAGEAKIAAAVVDGLQIPAFLCRQTDLLSAAGRSGLPVNIKKGQFMAPEDMSHAAAKVQAGNGRSIMLTERGTSFGYHNLVVDMRGLDIMRRIGWPVVFDATHSVQLPGAAGGQSGGDRRFAPVLARAAVAAGCDAVFIETYARPERALSDGANALPLSSLRGLWRVLAAMRTCLEEEGGWS